MARLQALAQDWLGSCWEYRPSGFWFWNDAMEPDGIKATIEEMAANDVREFLIHPVHGMTLEYLSEEFFERYRLALELAKERGLKVWIYDEYGWPSGNAGGKLLEEHPEHNGWLLHVSKDEEGKVKVEPRRCDRVMDNCIGAPWTTSPRGYVNTLSAEAMGCFIEMTHGRFYEELGELFDEVVVGFFTDEPAARIGCLDSDLSFWSSPDLPWTPELPGWFKERFGYDVEEHFAELTGAEPARVKRDFWELIKAKHCDAYHGQMARWCKAHGVKYTGHLGEDHLLMHVRFAGSAYMSLGQMDEPGIDYLGGGREPDERFIEEMVVTSITKHTGREKTYCEAYGVSGFSLTLGQMLREGQMFGLHGINDIALMGFQQSQRGVRKHTYWPPIFSEAPWWEFYGEFRDGFARSVGIAALGKRKARYAILYPQNALEQEDVFTRGESKDRTSRVMNEVGLAVYAAGEMFEFVFPEMLGEAKVADGKIVYPHAEYEAILACGDLAYFAESDAVLDRIAAEGGKVLRQGAAEMTAELKAEPASWAELVEIEHDGDVRIYQYEFEDGLLLVLRNAGERAVEVKVGTEQRLFEWDPVDGDIDEIEGDWRRLMGQYDTAYLTVSAGAMTENKAVTVEPVAIEGKWQIAAEQVNLAALEEVQFEHEEQGWIAAAHWAVGRERMNGVPNTFRGSEGAKFKGRFVCAKRFEKLGLVFERELVESLTVNGEAVDLAGAKECVVWDKSCVYVEIGAAAREGANWVEGRLRWERWETEVVNDAFYGDGMMMPACDIFAAGDFELAGGRLKTRREKPAVGFADLAERGWSQYMGTARLSTRVDLDERMAKHVRGLEVQLLREDAIEVLLDGEVLGRRVMGPYCFDIAEIAEGEHELTVRIASTSEGLVGEQGKWGVAGLRWLCEFGG
ncbi:MAG: hypothetical protein JW936_02895 [Sedimentisphaerales bacterium]|nr:hypothetical protein [Sedimentisphaerales bacterium]